MHRLSTHFFFYSLHLSTDLNVVGFAMYYFTYDPWVGKQLYLEEFYVMDKCRGQEIILYPLIYLK